MISILSKFNKFKFSNFISHYGQAGKLLFDLQKGQYDVALTTIWEDFTKLNIPNNQDQWNFVDDDAICRISNHSEGQHSLDVEIPEYYNYGGYINGNLIHKNGQVDAKLCGDIHLEISGQFSGNKIKSEMCDIKAKSFTQSSYIEAQNFILDVQSDIVIKKLLISQQARLIQQKGDIKINSIYSQPNMEDNKIIHNQEEIQRLINKNPHIKIYSKGQDGQSKFGNISGGLIMNMKGKQLKIRQLSGTFHIEHKERVDIGISDNSQGIIKANQINLRVCQSLKHNLYYNNELYQDGEFDEKIGSIYLYANQLNVVKVSNIFEL